MKSQIWDDQRVQELLYHGGNVTVATTLFPDAPRPWVDLSTGINAVPFPISYLPDFVWSRLPQSSDILALETAARFAYGGYSAADVVAVPGTQALIQWLPRLFPGQRVGVLDFTYSEYEICWREAGALVWTASKPQDLATFDIGIVVNPNNPDGRTVSPDLLSELAHAIGRRGGRLIVDEAFMDLENQANSLVPRLPVTGAIVLRSMGKTYGLAGLRLGFAFASTDDCALLRRSLGPWSVSGPAIEIGRRALMDEAWRGATIARLAKETARLDTILRRADFDIVGQTMLFRLARHSSAMAIFSHLCKFGILTRPFKTRPHLLRFGIPHQEPDWNRLIQALEGC